MLIERTASVSSCCSRCGRLPSEISISVAGMTFDWQPDGSGKVWDNKTSPQLQITAISFITPLIGGDPHDFLDERTEEDTILPTRAQVNELLASINRIRGNSNELVICLFVIIILQLIVMWRGH
jgi:hypothetical protein